MENVIPQSFTGQLNLDHCTPMRSGVFQGHCFHAIEKQVVIGRELSTMADEMVCCHCGRQATLSAGMAMPIFHGPHAPKRNP